MKIGTVLIRGKPEVAVGVGSSRAVLLSEIWNDGPADVMQIIGADAHVQQRIEALAGTAPIHSIDSLHWLPPVLRPGKVVCLALNSKANKERIVNGPGHPTLFTKPASSLIGHGQPVRLRSNYGCVHPGPELAVVIGSTGRDIKAADAYESVFGYTIINDLTSSTMRAEDLLHYRAAYPQADEADLRGFLDAWITYPGRYTGADTFGPIGPWIATRDEIPDPHALAIELSHQGRFIAEASTDSLLFSVPEVIEFVSNYMTLHPGDVIALGTTSDAGTEDPAWQRMDLNALGGPIEVTISGIGTLSNPIMLR